MIMVLFAKCADCEKILIGLLREFYRHPIKKGKYVCQDCNIKYEKYRNEKFLEFLQNEALLNKLKVLYDEGALSKTEYENERDKILQRL